LPQDQQHSLLLLQVSSAIIEKLAVLAKVSKLNGLLLLAARQRLTGSVGSLSCEAVKNASLNYGIINAAPGNPDISGRGNRDQRMALKPIP
jgi:hypothetical protein